MPRGLVLVINALFPGSMLVLRGSTATGSALLAVAGMACSASVIGAVTALPALRTAGAMSYGLLVLAATAILWSRLRRPPTDPAAMRRFHAAAAAAWLRDDRPAAQAAAQDLVRHAPAEAGAWRLLGLVAHDPAVTANALRHAERLESVAG